MSTNKKRTLAVIAGDIHRVEQAHVFEVGDYLIEAKNICEHGEWLTWLEDEFQWSDTTAGRYTSAARLAIKFPKLKNLKLGKSTLYELCGRDDDDVLPAIIAELAKHATRKRLKPADAERFMLIGEARVDHGDRPDATLYRLAQTYNDEVIEALKAANPETDEAASKIEDDIIEAQRAAEIAECEVEDEPELEPVEDEPELEPAAIEATARPEPRPVMPQPMPGDIGPMLPPGPPDEIEKPTDAPPFVSAVPSVAEFETSIRAALADLSSNKDRLDLLDQLMKLTGRLVDDMKRDQAAATGEATSAKAAGKKKANGKADPPHEDVSEPEDHWIETQTYQKEHDNG